jgi:hypothetical protein
MEQMAILILYNGERREAWCQGGGEEKAAERGARQAASHKRTQAVSLAMAELLELHLLCLRRLVAA